MAESLAVIIKTHLNMAGAKQDLRNFRKNQSKLSPVVVPVKINEDALKRSLVDAIRGLTSAITPINIPIRISEADGIDAINTFIRDAQARLNNADLRFNIRRNSDTDDASRWREVEYEVEYDEEGNEINSHSHRNITPRRRRERGGLEDAEENVSIDTELMDAGEKYINQFKRKVDDYVNVFKDAGAELTSQVVTYDPAKDMYKAVISYKDAMGEAASMTMTMKRDTEEVNIVQTKLTDNVEKHNRALRDSQKYIAAQVSNISNLESSAFRQKNPLDGSYREAANAGISRYREAIDNVPSDSILTNEQRIAIESAFKDAKRIIAEQKSAQWGATRLASKDITAQKDVSAHEINARINELKQLGVYSGNIATTFDDLQNSISEISDFPAFQKWQEDLRIINAEAKELLSSAKGKGAVFSKKLGEEQIAKTNDMLNMDAMRAPTTDGLQALKTEIERLQTKYRDFQTQLSSGSLSQDQFNELTRKIGETDAQLLRASNSLKIFDGSLKSQTELEKVALKIENAKDKLKVMEREYSAFKRNPALVEEFERLTESLNNADATNITRIMAEIRNFGMRIRAEDLGKMNFIDDLKEKFKKFGEWFSVSRIFMETTRTVKQMIDSVHELDDALVELRKVSDLTGNSLDVFTDKAFELGEKVGRTGTEVVNATATFKRAGYAMAESLDLAAAALVMTNVGDGITNVEDAASAMISVLKGFGMGASEVMSVVDKINQVSNTSAIDFDNITEGLRRVSGTLSQTGTSIEETIGLLTGSFGQLRDIESVSSGLIMISQRLRGIGEDGETIDGLAPKLQKEFKEIANIDIADTKTGELRSTFDILKDMYDIWPELNTQQRQYLGELAAGNRQVKVLNSLMMNWNDVSKAIDGAKNSAGSAYIENEKFMDSISGAINQFKSAFQQLSATTINSGLVKSIINIGTGILKIGDAIGGVQSVLLPLAGMAIGAKLPKILDTTKAIIKALKALKGGLGGISTSLKGLGVGLAISGVMLLISKFQEAKAEARALREESVQNALSTAEEMRTISKAYSEYETLSKIVNRTAEQQTALESAVNTVTSALGSQADALKTLSAGTEEYSEKLAELFGISQKSAKSKIDSGLIDATQNLITKSDSNSGLTDSFGNASVTLDSGTISKAQKKLSSSSDNDEKAILSQINDLVDIYFKPNYKDDLSKSISEFLGEAVYRVNSGNSDSEALASKVNSVYEAKALQDTLRDQFSPDGISWSDEAYKKIYDELGSYVSYLEEDANNVLNLYIEKYMMEFRDRLTDFDSYDIESRAASDTLGLSGAAAEYFYSQFMKNAPLPEPKENLTEEPKDSYSLLSNSMYSASAAYEKLQKAMEEQAKAGKISVATYQELIEANAEYAKFLTQTADGYELDTEALNEYAIAQDKLLRGKILDKIVRLKEELNDPTLTDDASDAIKNQIAQYGHLLNEIGCIEI